MEFFLSLALVMEFFRLLLADEAKLTSPEKWLVARCYRWGRV